jgi:TPP-dependent pyruvate/acetoin dehydrogenase alpha subunit
VSVERRTYRYTVRTTLEMTELESLYRMLFRIRRVEEEIGRVYPTDKIKSPVHLSIGQEAVSVGVCSVLRNDDVVFGTYRGHALYLAKGGDLRAMIAELYGKVSGCARGKGGSMHLVDVSVGVMGTSAVVATTVPQAVGYAYAVRLQQRDAVVISFFGDGATEEGAFHESMNFAALKQLPVVFICENNQYAIHSPLRRRQGQTDLCERARSYGVPAERIDDNDVLQIRERVGRAVARLRSGENGPYFFECVTYRWREHVGPREDYDAGYRNRAEAERWMANDQVKRIGQMIDSVRRADIEREVEAEIASAFAFAEQSPFPAPDELYSDLPMGAER